MHETIQPFSLKKIYLKMSPVNRRPYCLGQNVVAISVGVPVGGFNIKISSYQYRKSHCEDKTILRSSYLHNGISYTGKMTFWYWISAQGITCSLFPSVTTDKSNAMKDVSLTIHIYCRHTLFIRPSSTWQPIQADVTDVVMSVWMVILVSLNSQR